MKLNSSSYSILYIKSEFAPKSLFKKTPNKEVLVLNAFKTFESFQPTFVFVSSLSLQISDRTGLNQKTVRFFNFEMFH